MHSICDNPRQFMLFNRIELGLSNLRNIGRVGDLSDIFQAQADNDEDTAESSYGMLRGLVWAIPVLGFIGTVLGLSQAISQFGAVLSESADTAAIKPALQGVTAGLATAFETTLVALVAALFIQLMMTLVRHSEERLLDRCKDYCQRQLVGRLRLSALERGE
jgi:biopolymer transport protein ExbB/TolQ